MSESHFPSHSETLNERQPYMMEIPQWIRKALLSSERSRGVVCVRSLARGSIAGQSPTELGMLSSPPQTSINVPVLDSGIKQTRIVSKFLLACCRSSCLSIVTRYFEISRQSSVDHLNVNHQSPLNPASIQVPNCIPREACWPLFA